ncbi:Monoamine oxidase N [Colletotrichum higginsianum]|uniref:Amine oxidase n=1 Tax=Colletotrichum higginsianum TaxID=80884 RepID=A0A4V6TTA3_9PEZI|nr:Monoamine oxidase N [Colletotrichum higginsianum]
MAEVVSNSARSREGFAWNPEDGFTYGLRTPAVVPSTPEDALSSHYDVVVIGAGFAGLTAARDLALAGKSVLLVEARDRIGGRSWTAYGGKGEMLEMGGTWVHWQQPHIFSELQRYGLDDFLETQAFPQGCAAFSKCNVADKLMVQSPEEATEMSATTERLMAQFLDVDGYGGRTVIPFPFNIPNSVRDSPSYREIDRLSVADRVKELKDLTNEEKAILREHAASFFGTAPDQTSFSEVIHTYALCNFQPHMIEEATMKYKLSKGISALALAILEDYRGDRLLSSPVKSITQTNAAYGACVTLETGKKYRSKTIITTIPINVISSIQFDPPLSPLRSAAFSDGVTAAKIDKIMMTTSRNLNSGFSISCEGGDMPFTSGFGDRLPNGDPLLTFLCRPGVSFDSDESKIRLAETLHPDGLDITAAFAHLWSQDPFAQGVMPVRKAGFIGQYDDEVRRPHGKLYFCGSDFADGWRGFLSGAFESSYRVTREILMYLKDH